MRTETVTYQIFSLGELSPEARARAYRKWLNDEPEYGWNAENKQTLNAFCDLLGIRCNKWEYDGYSYSFSWYSPYEDTIENLHGARRHALQEGLAVLCAVCSNRKIGGSFEIDLCSD